MVNPAYTEVTWLLSTFKPFPIIDNLVFNSLPIAFNTSNFLVILIFTTSKTFKILPTLTTLLPILPIIQWKNIKIAPPFGREIRMEYAWYLQWVAPDINKFEVESERDREMYTQINISSLLITKIKFQLLQILKK